MCLLYWGGAGYLLATRSLAVCLLYGGGCWLSTGYSLARGGCWLSTGCSLPHCVSTLSGWVVANCLAARSLAVRDAGYLLAAHSIGVDGG